MNRFFSFPVLLAAVFLALSCSSQQEAPVKKAVRTPVYVGKVERVYPRYNYVLIALAGNVYEAGTVLISQSRNSREQRRVANLIVTGERMGRTRIPADIRSGAVEAGDLVFLYRNMAVPESSGSITDQQHPDHPSPETAGTGKNAEPPLAPEGDVTKDGLLPLPGAPSAPVPAVKPVDHERISREREKILRELDNIPGKLEDPWREFMSGNSQGK